MDFKDKLLFASISIVAISLFAFLLTAPGLVAASSTLYFSPECPHCQNVLDSGKLNRLPCMDRCNINEGCESEYSGVPVLEHQNKVLKGDRPIISYLDTLPYYSKMPSEEDEFVGEQKIGNTVYEVYEAPDGTKFLGRDIKSEA